MRGELPAPEAIPEPHRVHSGIVGAKEATGDEEVTVVALRGEREYGLAVVVEAEQRQDGGCVSANGRLLKKKDTIKKFVK